MSVITKTLHGKYDSRINVNYNTEDDSATVDCIFEIDDNLYCTKKEDLYTVLEKNKLEMIHRPGKIELEQHEIEWIISTIESITADI